MSRRSLFGLLILSVACFGLFAGFKESPSIQLSIPAPKNFPAQDTFSMQGGRWVTTYSADSTLQAHALLYLNRFRPGEGVITVCDLKTGAILVVAERDSTRLSSHPQIALQATFPAASLIKILTASAALEWNNTEPHDDLPLLGRSHTLYKFQLLPPRYSNYPKISLANAFAQSANPVFGSLGLKVGAEALRKMGRAFGFNQPQPMPQCSPSVLTIPDSGFGLAQVACGYTTSTTISPLHALRIVRGIGDDGRLKPLYFTPDLRDLKSGNRFQAPLPAPSEPFVSPATLSNLRTLMAATVDSGTARKGFHRAFGSMDMSNLEMGGKTGSLDGLNPVGQYEWYAGYARDRQHPDEGIAVTVMVINQGNRRVHATELAGLMIRDWAHPSILPVSGPTPIRVLASTRSHTRKTTIRVAHHHRKSHRTATYAKR